MKKALFIVLALSLSLFVIACGSAPAADRALVTGPYQMPPWANDLPPEDALWGIGIARQSTLTMSRTTAQARARTDIARQLDTRVQAMFTDYNVDAGPAGHQVSTSMQEDVSRQVTNINLAGARQIEMWSAADGTIWVLMEYRKSNARESIASILNNQEAAFAQFRAQQALDMLDAQLARTEAPGRVAN